MASTAAAAAAASMLLSFTSSTSYSHSQHLFLYHSPNSLTLRSNTLPIVYAKAHTRRQDRTARHTRIRKKVEGTPERPRLCVFRSNKHLYVQVIDDTKMHTLAAASTMQKLISEDISFSAGPTIEVAQKVGELIAKNCLEKGISKVAFDRGGYPYHGRVKALAEAAREHGLEF
ncbi:hypothetical protein KSS87_007166 [Heliosperma pusillum]|nr:hypothetical protein KSS87_007166 [Heliosperma pusillum]